MSFSVGHISPLMTIYLMNGEKIVMFMVRRQQELSELKEITQRVLQALQEVIKIIRDAH